MIELCVCMGLVGLLMVCVGQIVAAGTRYYNTATKTTDLQQSCLLTATALASELSEGNQRALLADSHKGAVFASPRNPNGSVSFDNRDMVWQKWVAYYVQDDGVNGFRLMRKEEPLNEPDPVVDAPFVPAEKSLAYFQGDTSNPGRMVARYIYDLEVKQSYPLQITIGAQDEVGDFRVMVQTKVKMRN